MDFQKSIFKRLNLGYQFFYISGYLTDKYFDIILGCHTPVDPQIYPPKINFLNGLTSGASFFDISRFLTDKYFDVIWSYHTFGDLRKINLIKAQARS